MALVWAVTRVLGHSHWKDLHKAQSLVSSTAHSPLTFCLDEMGQIISLPRFISVFVRESNASVFASETQRIVLSSHRSFPSPSVLGRGLGFCFLNCKHTQVSVWCSRGFGLEAPGECLLTRRPQVPSWILDWGQWCGFKLGFSHLSAIQPRAWEWSSTK